jgi:signal transduction histidine kinase
VIVGIRVKFFLVFFFSLAIGIFVFFFLNGMARNNSTDLSLEVRSFDTQFNTVFNEVKAISDSFEQLNTFINTYSKKSIDIFIVDKSGNVLLAAPNNYYTKIDFGELKKLSSTSNYIGDEVKYGRAEKISDDKYLVVTTVLIKNDKFQFIFIALPIFILLFFMLTYNRIKYIKMLTDSLKIIAGGNLDIKAPVKGRDELSILAENINQMACELKINKQREREVEKSKDELIVNVSHDLRTPLTSIMGYTKLIREKYTIDQEFEKYLGIVDNKLNRFNTLINDLFEYSKLSSNVIKLNKEKVLFNELIRQVLEELMPLGLQNSVELKFSSISKNELSIEADPSMLARVFENVISNAIKYSLKPGIVEVKTYKEEMKATCCVCNMGSNLSNEESSKIFNRFYRTDIARNSESGGSGLGLSIAKSIVGLHNGQIWAECNDGDVCIFVSLDCILNEST